MSASRSIIRETIRLRRLAPIALVVIAAIAVACGSDSEAPAPAPAPTTAPAAPAAPTTAPAVAVAQEHGDAYQRPGCRADCPSRAYGHGRRPIFACSISHSPSSSDGDGHVWSCCCRHPNVRASADSRPSAHDRTRDASSGSGDGRARDISSGSADSRARSGCCDRDPGTSADRSAADSSSNTAPITHSRAADVHARCRRRLRLSQPRPRRQS